MRFDIRENIFACLFSVHNTISLSRHEQVCLSRHGVIDLLYYCNLSNVKSLKYVSMNNQGCKVRPKTVNVNNDKAVFFPFSIKVRKYSGRCNNINNPYAKLCVSDVVKNLNVRVFNLLSRTNKKKQIEWHETCQCKCRLDGRVCNNKKRWNEDKCRCEWEELIDKGVCDK